jgi:hypothetical protein
MAATSNPITGAWSPGQVIPGASVEPAPKVFAQPVVFQKGFATGVTGSSPPVITTPGTVASAGTVTNSTGFDCMVYLSATTGIQKIVYPGLAGGTVAGTTPAAQTAGLYVANNQPVAVTYTGTLTWTWIPV